MDTEEDTECFTDVEAETSLVPSVSDAANILLRDAVDQLTADSSIELFKHLARNTFPYRTNDEIIKIAHLAYELFFYED